MAFRQHQATGQANQPFFSIIMNVYNGEAYLKEAIGSVLEQSFCDWELVIWDDVSTDGSAQICLQYSAEDPRIHYYLSPEHTQIGQARNLAIAKAQGSWLAFLDQDDIWTANKLAGQHRLIVTHTQGRLGLVYGRAIQFDNQGRMRDFDRWHEFSGLPEGDVFSELLSKPSFICLSSAVLLKSAVEEIGGVSDSINYCPDYYLFVRVAQNYRAACLQEHCCWYRKHPGGMSSTYQIPIYLEALAIISQQADRLDGRVFARRKKVYHSLIGLHEIMANKSAYPGLRRIVSDGSLVYLMCLPVLHALRAVRRFFKKSYPA